MILLQIIRQAKMRAPCVTMMNGNKCRCTEVCSTTLSKFDMLLKNFITLCAGEAFFKAISKPGAGTWPVFRVLRKCALDLKPKAGMNPENSATAKNYCTWALRYRLSKNLIRAMKLPYLPVFKGLKI